MITEEAKAIAKVLQYDMLAEKYDSENGDYFRYLYRIAFSLPVILMIGQVEIQEANND